ncbi:calcium-binding protein, partial [Roseomonas sp. CECT 9278]|uniref:calcium-binding protein n=1 Tax=Roseomonas sp. CECT 9278 TaxID=2845823 RepID=UPI001E42A061
MSWTSAATGETTPGATEESDVFAGFDSIGDVADGLGGDDVLRGNDGADTLEGGIGYDQVNGGEGADSITDSADGGFFAGDGGDDTIAVTLGGVTESFFGRVQITGGEGDDRIIASGTGVEYTPDPSYRFGASITGDAGNDTIVGSDAATGLGFDGDQLNGGEGNDSILGGAGDDQINADNFFDTIGNDTVDAGDGNDYVYSYAGVDSLVGGAGIDSVSIDRDDATAGLGYTVNGAGGLTGTDGTSAAGFESFTIRTGAGNDTLDGTPSGAGSVFFVGNGGNDRITTGAGDDVVYGDDQSFTASGNDTIATGAGNDQVRGGEGADSITDSADGGFFAGDGGDDTIAVTLGGVTESFFGRVQ